MSTTVAVAPTGYLVGSWDIDPAHTNISFSVRHMMVSKVRGNFRTFSGTITTADDPTQSSVEASIDLASIDTNNDQRDAHIRSADFFEVEKYPHMTFKSTAIRPHGNDWSVVGDLSLHGVTKPVELLLELNGFGPDGYGGTRAGFSATAEISRREFGIDIDMPLDGGGVVVGDKISISLEIEAILQK